MSIHEVIPFPKFYTKSVGGAFTVEHRLTHTYLASCATEEELAEKIAEYNAMSDRELWEFLISNFVIIPKKEANKIGKDFHANDEEWYLSAWGIYTAVFYKKHPELLVIVEKIPYEVINEIRREKQTKEVMAAKAREAERKRFEVEEKEMHSKHKDNFVVGDQKTAEKVRTKLIIKKKKNIKIRRTKSGISVPIISDGLFD